MFRKTKHLLTFLPLALLLAGCHESYPTLYMEVPEDPVVNAENGETGKVPIVPTLSDPQYEIYTRGSGAFGPYSEDQQHWENADFRTFALLTANQFSLSDANGRADYRATDTDHRLLFDQRMRITDGSLDVNFFDRDGNPDTKYYNWSHQSWKYNFFTD